MADPQGAFTCSGFNNEAFNVYCPKATPRGADLGVLKLKKIIREDDEFLELLARLFVRINN